MIKYLLLTLKLNNKKCWNQKRNMFFYDATRENYVMRGTFAVFFIGFSVLFSNWKKIQFYKD